MYKTTKLLAAGATAAVLTIGMAACGGGGGDDNKTTGNEFNGSLNAVVNASDKTGGTLNLVNSSDADYYDPGRAYYAWAWNFMRLYTRTLVTYDPKPGKAGLEFVPDLATEVPKSPDGGKTWKLTLKDGVKFEDGTPITTKDIKYGIERVFAQDVINGGPTYLVTWLDNGQNYKGPYLDKSPEGLKSVETPDDKTIIFHLQKPFADFPHLLAMPDTSPVPAAKDTKEKYTNHPVSSGPYKFSSYQPGKSLVLDRNPNWDKKTDSVRKALPDKINLTLGLEADDIDNRLLAGSIDIDTAQTGVQPAAQAKILSSPDLKKNADTPVTGFIRYVSIQTKVPPFDNVHCRKAVQYAADKTTMQTARGGPVAGGDIASTMLPTTLKEYAKFDLYPSPGGKGDIAKAKDELAQCGKPTGFTTILASRNKGKEPLSAVALQEGLKRAGINAQIQQFDAAAYFSTVIGVPDNVHRKKFGLAMAGWGADFPSAYGFMSEIVDGRKIKANGNQNYSEINDPAINAGIDAATGESDEAKRVKDWQDVDKKVMEDASLMPFTYDKALNYRNPRTTNVYVTSAYGMYDFQALGVQ
jgi:peptide/nickel transport system substrate-binding protein